MTPFLAAIVSLVFFSVLDAFIWPVARRQHKAIIRGYRIGQIAFLAFIVIGLFGSVSLGAALAFLILWWTFIADFLFYLINDFVRHENAFQREVMSDRVTWASWTPIGLLGAKTTGKALIIQGAIGVFVAVFVSLI